MDINKLSNHVNGQLNGTSASEASQNTAKTSSVEKSNGVADKVSLNGFKSRKSEEIFAQIELEKLNQSSFSKLKNYKMKLQEYEAAKKESPEAAQNTEIGKMLNDPDVLSKIAQNIVDK